VADAHEQSACGLRIAGTPPATAAIIVLLHLRIVILAAAAVLGCIYWPSLADDPAPRTAGVLGDAIALAHAPAPTVLASSR
jgi:hypothetical protein